MTRRWLPLLTVAALALQLAGCGAGGADSSNAADPSANTEATLTSSPTGIQIVPGAESSPSPGGASATGSSAPAASAPSAESSLLNAAHEVAGALRDRDLKRLADWVDPVNGVRFSPYAHIDEKNGIVWLPDEIPSFKDTQTFNWGAYDGSGETIQLSFRDYFEKFVYDQDFADAPDITANKLLGMGNTEFNGLNVYPNASFVELHYPGFDSKLDGQDWESLILVFTPSGQDWRLNAIVHSQWTI